MIYLNSPSQKENIIEVKPKGFLNPHPSTPQTKHLLRFPSEVSVPASTLSTKSSSTKFFKDDDLNIKHSSKENGIVKAYAVLTDKGLVRNYNEDRVSIILNILKPSSRSNEVWPYCSFFGIYDGHGGSKCADFLRDNLHQLIIRDSNFPFNAKEAITQGFRQAELLFSSMAESTKEKSGSCAIVVLIIGNNCYVANLGDSRAILSGRNGDKVYALSKDHKPSEENEQKRIIENGGKVYQSNVTIAPGQTMSGPFRVLPGKLSVSRTIGDYLAKASELGGNPHVIISVPDIKVFKILSEHDFVIIGSDGVFDRLNNREIIQSAWSQIAYCKETSPHRQAANAVENILNAAFMRRSLDNLTIVLIAFNNFSEALQRIHK
jgi:protein phosphatase PTC2/3